MTYHSISLLKNDTAFLDRTAACYAQETFSAIGTPAYIDPAQWATQHAWTMASAPGFGDAYQYALDTDNEKPGSDPGVITDSQILASVQAIMTAEAPS
jgi:hypothetical protein